MKTTFSTLLFLFIYIALGAQEKNLRNFELFWTVGFVEMDIEKLPTTINGDYLNFFSTYPNDIDLITSKLGFRFDFSNKLSTEAVLILTDDLIPDNFDFSAYYKISSRIMIGAGSMLYKNWITLAEDNYLKNQTNYYRIDGLSRDFRIYDWGFYITPVARPIYNNTFKTILKLKLGYSRFSKLESTYLFKRVNSNERKMYSISTSQQFQPFINPSISLQLKFFDIRSTSIGMLCNSSFFYSKRNIDYKRSVQIWTNNGNSTNNVTTDKHKYNRFECDMGIYVSW